MTFFAVLFGLLLGWLGFAVGFVVSAILLGGRDDR